ncbi:redoxin domain-containing protein [Candidatus Poribacteria bacterium]|nr:redoxin domain-containing protein [Candidatus Poribacteria bacterium]
MRKFLVSFGLIFTLALTACTLAAEKDTENPVKIDEKVKEWSLKDTENETHSLKKLREEKKAVVLVFLATQCPGLDDYIERINTLVKDYKEKKVQFVGIHSNKHETIEEIKKYRKKHNFDFPILKDPDNELADYFQARRTPEVFLIDAKNILRYRGAIDDSRKTPETHYLKNMLNLILEGKPIPDKKKKTRAIGCTIKRVRKADLDRTP